MTRTMTMLSRPTTVLATLLSLAALALPAVAQDGDWLTPGEASHYSRYTQNDDVARFLCRLDHAAAVTGAPPNPSMQRTPAYRASIPPV